VLTKSPSYFFKIVFFEENLSGYPLARAYCMQDLANEVIDASVLNMPR